jgi:pyruvate-formate lyase
MGMPMTRTKEFRRLAQECRVTAQTLSTEQARAEMLAMADVCDRVAAQQSRRTDVPKQMRRAV